ncbi:MAG: DUF1003 domain-containing protein [Planctomycetaceae bacterium]
MSKHRTSLQECRICHRSFPLSAMMPGEMVRPVVSELILAEHPDWTNEGYLCLSDLNRYRGQYVQKVLETEQGELTSLEDEVLLSMRQHELLAANVDVDFDGARTIGQRIADVVARFGGSWTFIISFGVVLSLWILINTHLVLTQPFDPFPFILLNLVLSCLAAIQAPVIMMSQNRQEIKDRLRGEHDYQVNLKAELEIRQLHSKLDLMMTHQWHRLLEIQQVQTDLLQELMLQNSAQSKLPLTPQTRSPDSPQ